MTEAVRRVEAAPGVQVVELHRPDRLNALSTEVLQGLHDALDALAADESCRVVVLTGAGRGFCAGLDLVENAESLSEVGDRSPQQRMRLQKHIAALVPKLRALPQPVVAAVNGPAAGGGLALALASDIRLAAPTARFDIAFLQIGVSACDIGVSWLLPRLIGASRAFEILLTGRTISATEAERIGLVSRVVTDGDVVEAALAVAQDIARHSPMGVRMTKEVMWSQLEVASLTAGIDLENRTQILTSFSRDQDEALAAFKERRQPDFHDH
jgi:enoyl-CoA hydratase